MKMADWIDSYLFTAYWFDKKNNDDNSSNNNIAAKMKIMEKCPNF